MINSHRLLVRGVRTDPPPPEELEEIKTQQVKDFSYYLNTYWHYLLIVGITLAVVLAILFWQRKKEN